MPENEKAMAEEAAPRTQARSGLLRNVLATVAIGLAIAATVWTVGHAGGARTSQSLSLTATGSGPAPKVGAPAPDFRLVSLDGSPVQLSQLRGRPVWLTFWATWCPPCRQESPDVEAAYQKYGDQGLVVLAVDVSEDGSTVRDYAERAGLTFPIVLDQTQQIAAMYRIAGAPTHYFIDADGVVRDEQMGSMNMKTIEKKLASILTPADARAR